MCPINGELKMRDFRQELTTTYFETKREALKRAEWMDSDSMCRTPETKNRTYRLVEAANVFLGLLWDHCARLEQERLFREYVGDYPGGYDPDR